MNILVIDGMGGGIGKAVIERLRESGIEARITAVGTNSHATSVMMKAGANQGATGENPVICCCKKADVIIGALGIVLADAMLGEITATMATAISSSEAHRILIPTSRCGTTITGLSGRTLSQHLAEIPEILADIAGQGG